MFPWTAPSEKDSSDRAEVRVFVINPTGLTRWVDYIPVVNQSSPDRADSYDNSGSIRVEELESISGLTAWVDYVPVSEDAGAAAGKWRFDANGWIPVTGMNP